MKIDFQDITPVLRKETAKVFDESTMHQIAQDLDLFDLESELVEPIP